MPVRFCMLDLRGREPAGVSKLLGYRPPTRSILIASHRATKVDVIVEDFDSSCARGIGGDGRPGFDRAGDAGPGDAGGGRAGSGRPGLRCSRQLRGLHQCGRCRSRSRFRLRGERAVGGRDGAGQRCEAGALTPRQHRLCLRRGPRVATTAARGRSHPPCQRLRRLQADGRDPRPSDCRGC